MPRFFCALAARGLLITTLLAGTSTMLVAAPLDLYRVELLIFMNLTQSEEIPPVPAEGNTIDTSGAVDFRRYACLAADADPTQTAAPQTQQDVEQCLNGYLRLNELTQPMMIERLKLEQSTHYKVLKHAAWQQPALSPDRAMEVRLNATSDGASLDGTMELSREKYLQLDINLWYQTSRRVGVPVQAFRKLRPGELNYLDHPHIGILALVTPVPQPDIGEVDTP